MVAIIKLYSQAIFAHAAFSSFESIYLIGKIRRVKALARRRLLRSWLNGSGGAAIRR
jgi:hypothetical protein